MSANEFREWIEFYQLEPFGNIQEDWRIGYLIANVLTPFRGKGKPPFNAMDFAPGTVNRWAKLLRETESKIAEMNGGEPAKPIPVHPTIEIFEEILRANRDNVDRR